MQAPYAIDHQSYPEPYDPGYPETHAPSYAEYSKLYAPGYPVYSTDAPVYPVYSDPSPTYPVYSDPSPTYPVYSETYAPNYPYAPKPYQPYYPEYEGPDAPSYPVGSPTYAPIHPVYPDSDDDSEWVITATTTVTFTSTSTIYVPPTGPTESVKNYGLLKRSAKFLFQRAGWCSEYDMPCRLVVYNEDVIKAACKKYLRGGDDDVVTVTKWIDGPTVTETAIPNICVTGDYSDYTDSADHEGDHSADEGEWSDDVGKGKEHSDGEGHEGYAASYDAPSNDKGKDQGYEAPSDDKPYHEDDSVYDAPDEYDGAAHNYGYDETDQSYETPTPNPYGKATEDEDTSPYYNDDSTDQEYPAPEFSTKYSYDGPAQGDDATVDPYASEDSTEHGYEDLTSSHIPSDDSTASYNTDTGHSDGKGEQKAYGKEDDDHSLPPWAAHLDHGTDNDLSFMNAFCWDC
jgi:hypothetical protein